MIAKVNKLRELLCRNGAFSDDAIQTKQANIIPLRRRRGVKQFKVRQRAIVARRDERYLTKVSAPTGSAVR
jgi:hypothetical protein